jgi:cell filamentation protein
VARSTLTSSAAVSVRVRALPDFVDHYLDPLRGLLRNQVGATRIDVLEVREAELTAFAGVELAAHPVKVTGHLQQLQCIHKRLFGDVYPWAGELRTVDMRKGTDAAAEFFISVSRLQFGAGFAFQELAHDNRLRGIDRDSFVDRLAHHYDQVNYLHPFREGNGRTQRIFWSQIAADAGYELDWRKTTDAVNDQASRDAMKRENLGGQRSMFDTIVARPAAGSKPPSPKAARCAAFLEKRIERGGEGVTSAGHACAPPRYRLNNEVVSKNCIGAAVRKRGVAESENRIVVAAEKRIAVCRVRW